LRCNENAASFAKVDEKANLSLTAEALRHATKADPFAVICGGETGVKARSKLCDFHETTHTTTCQKM